MTTLRAALFSLYFYALTTLLGIAGIGVRLFARHHALAFARFWIVLVLAGLRHICGIRICVTGRENLPESGPALLASQHQSAFDTLVWLTLLPRPSYVMKQELTRIPLFGPLLVPAGMIPVDRKAGQAALRGMVAATLRARDSGRQIVIFPEGTRVPPGEHVTLQPGIAAVAIRLGLPVIPVATDSGRHWRKAAFGKIPGTIHIAIGPPIPAGTPRQALLDRIEDHWHAAAAQGFAPVHNSVGKNPPELPVTLK
jgi:1-acyl-sn-glycerol-3-phosphate acyltransferase